MNREILFRAKEKETGIWVDGDLSRCVVVGETHIRRIEENLSTTTHKVDPETVCQYTGLTDKNGRKIFEGDIVKAIYKPRDKDLTIDDFIIKWDKYYCKFVGCYVGKENVYNPLLLGSQTYFEVIGNIFDNADLLKE